MLECPGRRERRREETKTKIVNSAMELLAEKPYDQITVEDITERADVAKGTFFRHFPSKDLVLLEYVDALVEEVNLQIEQILCGNQGESAWELLERIAVLVAEHDGRSKTFARTLTSICCTNEEVRRALVSMHDDAAMGTEQLILYGVQKGEFRSDVPARQVAEQVIRLYAQCLHIWCMREEITDLTALVRETLAFFKPAIDRGEAK